MEEYVLNKQESLTVMNMVHDAIQRGMIASGYEIGTLEEIIENNTDFFESFTKDFEIVIKVKDKTE